MGQSIGPTTKVGGSKKNEEERKMMDIERKKYQKKRQEELEKIGRQRMQNLQQPLAQQPPTKKFKSGCPTSPIPNSRVRLGDDGDEDLELSSTPKARPINAELANANIHARVMCNGGDVLAPLSDD